MAEKKNGEVAGQPPKAKVNKMEAVRQALVELGNDATTTNLQGFLKERFGLEMSTKFIATYRGDILKKAAARTTAPESQAATPAPSQGPRDQAGSKMDGVRRALNKLGKDATTTRIQALLKDELGIEMPLKHITNYKSKVLRKAAGKDKSAKKPAAQKAAARTTDAPPAPVATAPTAVGKGKGGIALDDILATKSLLERVGAEEFLTLIDVLAK